jgi:hypothetical protein
MLHTFATDDFLSALDDFDRHARQGQRHAAGNSCRKGAVGAGSPEQVRTYAALGSTSAALAVCRDLWAMADHGHEAGPLLAEFEGPALQGARHVESLLWRQLQTMHGMDAPYFDWAEAAKADPAQRLFSIGGKPWRIWFLPDAARPGIVFEPHRG